MKEIHFLIGILAIISLYYLLNQSYFEGLINSQNPDSCVPVNLGNPYDERQISDHEIESLPSVAKMQAINQAVSSATNDMVRESAQTVRQIPLHPVPPVEGVTQDQISLYLMKINDSMDSLVATYSSPDNTSDNEPKSSLNILSPAPTPSSFESMNTMNLLSNTSFGDVSNMTNEEIYVKRPLNRLKPEELRKYFGSGSEKSVCPSGCVKPTKKNKNCSLAPPPPYKNGEKPKFVQCSWQCPDKESDCLGIDKKCLQCTPLAAFPLEDCLSYENATQCNIDSRCSWDNKTGWCDEKGLKFSFK